MVSLLLQVHYRPYVYNEANWLETGLLTLNLFILSLSFIFVSESPRTTVFDGDNNLYNFFSGLLLFLVFAGIAFAVVITGLSVYKSFFKPNSTKVTPLASRDQPRVHRVSSQSASLGSDGNVQVHSFRASIEQGDVPLIGTPAPPAHENVWTTTTATTTTTTI